MPTCEMCGKETDHLLKAKIVGSVMFVCADCAKRGDIIEDEDRNLSHTFYKKKKQQEEYEIVSNYQSIINRELSKKNLDIHKFSRAINIKESILSKMLQGKLKLDIDTARKIENYLEIKLVEKYSPSVSKSELLEQIKLDEKEDKIITLADLILKEMKKKNNK